VTGQDPDDAFAHAFHEAFDGMGRGDAGSLADPAPDPEVEARAHSLAKQVGRELAAAGPHGWRRLDAVFALTSQAEIARVVYTDGTRATDIGPSAAVLRLVREQRALAARLPAGPWWRMVLTVSATGDLSVHYDHGAEPIPAEHRFPPQFYRADLAEFDCPAENLPTWLAAYLGHGDRHVRSPATAAANARADAEGDVRPVWYVDGMPDLLAMWARWATLSAAFVAVRSAGGPRMLPSYARFDGAERGGSSLWLLPGDRAVLSGGVWNAPTLAATYRGEAAFPDLFAGAPEWVADPVLDARGAGGLMSFCYWWFGGRWGRGESPEEPDEIATAIPGVWTADTVTGIVTSLVERDDETTRRAAAALVAAAEGGFVRRDMVIRVFGEGGDIDGAFYQLMLAGVVERTDLPPIPEHVAIGIVRNYMLDNGLEAPGYRVADLTAERLSVGWVVYIPEPPGELMIGRTYFYVADDGVLEEGTSAMPPSYADAEFERRYRERTNT
jgi:hypothetical protein